MIDYADLTAQAKAIQPGDAEAYGQLMARVFEVLDDDECAELIAKIQASVDARKITH